MYLNTSHTHHVIYVEERIVHGEHLELVSLAHGQGSPQDKASNATKATECAQ